MNVVQFKLPKERTVETSTSRVNKGGGVDGDALVSSEELFLLIQAVAFGFCRLFNILPFPTLNELPGLFLIHTKLMSTSKGGSWIHIKTAIIMHSMCNSFLAKLLPQHVIPPMAAIRSDIEKKTARKGSSENIYELAFNALQQHGLVDIRLNLRNMFRIINLFSDDEFDEYLFINAVDPSHSGYFSLSAYHEYLSLHSKNQKLSKLFDTADSLGRGEITHEDMKALVIKFIIPSKNDKYSPCSLEITPISRELAVGCQLADTLCMDTYMHTFYII